MLRVMIPGVQRTFFRTRQAAQDYSLESLMDMKVRRELVQQMSSVSNVIPGSVGERRKMRQDLEAMVHQVEAETADLGMNGGAGRIPSGFCTLTCAVYKWEQLHETVLKSYPSGPSVNPASRQYYTQWKPLPPGSAREVAMHRPNYGAVACAVAWRVEAQAKLAGELRNRMGVDVLVEEIPDLRLFGCVDDHYASFEWSEGGMIHAHIAFWVVGVPRIDKIEVPREKEDGS